MNPKKKFKRLLYSWARKNITSESLALDQWVNNFGHEKGIRNIWEKDGILKVQITHPPFPEIPGILWVPADKP